VAIVERKWFIGTCVNNGCTPTKTLVASAKAILTARMGNDYGFSVLELLINIKTSTIQSCKKQVGT